MAKKTNFLNKLFYFLKVGRRLKFSPNLDEKKVDSTFFGREFFLLKTGSTVSVSEVLTRLMTRKGLASF